MLPPASRWSHNTSIDIERLGSADTEVGNSSKHELELVGLFKNDRKPLGGDGAWTADLWSSSTPLYQLRYSLLRLADDTNTLKSKKLQSLIITRIFFAVKKYEVWTMTAIKGITSKTVSSFFRCLCSIFCHFFAAMRDLITKTTKMTLISLIDLRH